MIARVVKGKWGFYPFFCGLVRTWRERSRCAAGIYAKTTARMMGQVPGDAGGG